MRYSPRKRAFTMVEIVVAVSIVILLTALLFPSVARYLSDAQASRCLSKQRRLATACLQFAAENGGRLPVSYAGLVDEDGKGSFYSSWYYDVEPYMGESAKKFMVWLRCPAAKETNVSTIGVHSGRSGAGQAGPCVQGNNVQRRLLATVPPTCILTGCTGNNVGTFLNPVGWRFNVDTDGDGLRDSHNTGQVYNGLRFRHRDRAAVVCMDGSARLITPKDWVENRGNLWGVINP